MITWPSDRNQEDCNPSHARHPELRSYSHLYLHCRAVLEPGADEIIAMATASMVSVPSGARSVAIVSVPHNRASAHRELSRRTPDSLRDRGPGIGFSADNATLVVIRDDNCLIIPRDIVTGVALDRVKPAKGPGGANLVVEYEDPFSSAHRRRWITLYTSDAIGGLDELAPVFALWAERTLKVEASDDV